MKNINFTSFARVMIGAVCFMAGAASAAPCDDAISLPSGERFCIDRNMKRHHPVCTTDPALCPGAILDPCLSPGSDPNGAACADAKARADAHQAIMTQCYTPGARRTDSEATAKCSNVWR
jgi:hypothetical protein